MPRPDEIVREINHLEEDHEAKIDRMDKFLERHGFEYRTGEEKEWAGDVRYYVTRYYILKDPLTEKEIKRLENLDLSVDEDSSEEEESDSEEEESESKGDSLKLGR